MDALSRRSFIKVGVAAGAMAGGLHVQAEKASATDVVTLGRSGIKTTRLAFGTGTLGGKVQQDLGQDGFTRLVRYAYDRGSRFFETAESYDSSQQMLAVALKGIPRESYTLMSKVTTTNGIDPMVKLDELRRNSDTDYFDIMLLHCQHTDTWFDETKHWQDAVMESQAKGHIKSRGVSVHGLPALRQVPGKDGLDVAMIRMNHKGTIMDAESYEMDQMGNVPEVVAHVKQVKKEGMGVISMKLIGEGAFNHEDRQKAMRFAFKNAGVDAVTVGYKNTAEIDEAIENLNLALA